MGRMKKMILRGVAGTLAAVVLVVAVGWLAFVPTAREPDYRFVDAWGEKGSGLGQFNDPTGVAVAGDEVFVADARNGRIQVFDKTGSFKRVIGRPGDGKGELSRPMNLTFARGRLYVAEYFNDRVQVFSLSGESLALIGKPGSGPGRFNAPGGVGVAADGSLYVADFYNHRIQHLSASGDYLGQLGKTGKPGWRGGEFSYPTDVTIAANGDIVVADGYNDRVQVFNASGRLKRKWGGPFAANIHGPFNGWFATVTSVAIGPHGNIFVADFYNHRVQKFTARGAFLTSFGKKGDGPGKMFHPIAVAVDADGTVYVTDFGNNRVSRWRQ